MSDKNVAIEDRIGKLLKEYNLTVAVAESCTGGLVCDRLTNVSGSSAYVMGGVVSYSNEAKMNVLGVNPQTLAEVGAVSERTATEMAQGVRRLLHTDIGLSTTGIAGPGGGTPEKPIGLVHIHLSSNDTELAEHFVWTSDRIGNKQLSADAVLALLERYLSAKAGA